MMMSILNPDVALFVTEHPVWLHSDLQTLVEPGRRKYIRRPRHILIYVYMYVKYLISMPNIRISLLILKTRTRQGLIYIIGTKNHHVIDIKQHQNNTVGSFAVLSDTLMGETI